MIKMLAVEPTYYRSRPVPVGEVFEVDNEAHADIMESRGWAKRITAELVVIEPMTTEEASPIVKRPRGRPPKNKVLNPSSGGDYQTK